MIIKKLMTTLVAAVMVFALTGVAFASEAHAAGGSLIEDVEYKGKGVVEIDFSKDVKYKKVKVKVKDNKGKKYGAKVLSKDEDDLTFKIKNYKMGRTYTFAIKGVKAKNAKKYRTVKGKVWIKAPAPTQVTPKPVTPQPAPQPTPQNPAAAITADEARDIALADAGLTLPQVFMEKVKLDRERGILVYDVEFKAGSHEYDYDINATDGSIVKKEVTPKPAKPQPAPQPTPQNPAAAITADEARDIALADAGLTLPQVFMEKVKLDRERGILVYEVEFKAEYYEYDYDINAADGSIVKKDVEFDY